MIHAHSLNTFSSAGDESTGKACADEELNVQSHLKPRSNAQPISATRVRLSSRAATPKHRPKHAVARYVECESRLRK